MTEEREIFACLIAFYVGTLNGDADWIVVMQKCVDKAKEYEFPMTMEYDEEVIDTDAALDDAYAIATEISNDFDNRMEN